MTGIVWGLMMIALGWLGYMGWLFCGYGWLKQGVRVDIYQASREKRQMGKGEPGEAP